MADLKISQLPLLTGAALQADDAFAVVDISASETKKITTKDLIQSGIQFIDDLSIPGDKVDVTFQPGSVGTVELADKSVTQEKLADQSTAILASPLPVNGAYVGQLGVDTSNNAAYIWDGNTWVRFQTGLVDIQGGTVGDVFTQVTIDGDSASVLAQINDSTVPAEFLAGPTTSAGEVVLRTIVPADLPIATTTTAGIVTVPQGGGLKIDGGDSGLESNLVIDNDINSSADYHVVTYNSKGLITAGREIISSDLPVATENNIGAISINSGDFNVTPEGELQIANQVPAGEHAVVTYNDNGLITSGRDLTEDDIPELDASKITSGEFGPDQLGECSVTGPKICDYATCLMQEDNPGPGDFLGQFWYTPSTAQLRVYARGSGPENIWLPVGFGALQANNLRWGGTYNADTDTLGVLTAVAVSAGLTAGQAFPPPTDELSGIYFVCQKDGGNMTQNNLQGINHTSGDWALCLDGTQGWIHIDANAGGGGGGGGAQFLDDLLDVTIGGAGGPFSTAPSMTLAEQQLLKYDAGDGQWKNTDLLNGGSF